MPKINFREANGKTHTVDAALGFSLMEAAVKGLVPGIDADCGGACACATCHVHISPPYAELIPAPSDAEATMLEFANGVDENSRLSCQIKVTEALNEFVVQLPASQ